MFSSSIPAYLDPANWQQQQPNQQTGVNSQLQSPQPPPPQQPHVGSSGSIRPGSMADRARMANLPIPEQALKCPRCESTNTKFCYFNNYSLSQPRHFCKTCRRYWTRGGSLRNVPVGGGCRRNNKRSSKGSSTGSKSPASSGGGGGDIRQTGAGNSTSCSSIPSNSGVGDLIGLGQHVPPPLRFTNPLHHLADHYGSGEIGLNYTGISSHAVGIGGDINFMFGNNSSGDRAGGGVGGGSGNGSGFNLSSEGIEQQWRLPQVQQFPFFSSLDPSPGLFPLEGGLEPSSYIGGDGQVRPKAPTTSGFSHMMPSSVKMEDNQLQGLNLSRQFLGINQGNEHQYWSGTNAWNMDLSGTFGSSSTSHPL